jgi:hypothetical protein
MADQYESAPNWVKPLLFLATGAILLMLLWSSHLPVHDLGSIWLATGVAALVENILVGASAPARIRKIVRLVSV